MQLRNRHLNLILLITASLLVGMAAWLNRLPPLVNIPSEDGTEILAMESATTMTDSPSEQVDTQTVQPDTCGAISSAVSEIETPLRAIENTAFRDADPSAMLANHPFRREALKVLNGHLEENDSISRRRILSYCEHLRSAYTTRDIDFIRQVFSDNALIIVGHVVKNAKSGMTYSEKVQYSIRSKKEYVERLGRIFTSKKQLDLKFSDFRIMRHPTMPGIYGVTLRQEYTCDAYSDDGWLFLLWDFRNPSMPMIHVRTWQPAQTVDNEGEIIDISDFNLE